MHCPNCSIENTAGAQFCHACGGELPRYVTPVSHGTVFDGKYEVHDEIGRGGMGVVYAGKDLSLGRPVAIKVLPERFNTQDEVIARFKKEAQAMAALDHPNIVPIYAIGQQRNFHYFVMKRLDGATVAESLEGTAGRPSRTFSPAEVRDMTVQVCAGLQHAHERGLVHRDIKPGNIMIGPDGHATIMDFGIVKVHDSADQLTRTGLVFGTPEYMPPEQAQGQSPPCAATDIYALGIVAYEMLAGRPPFTGESPFSVVIKHIKEPPPRLFGEIIGVSETLQSTIFKALEKDPEARYEDARCFGRAMERVSLTMDPSASPLPLVLSPLPLAPSPQPLPQPLLLPPHASELPAPSILPGSVPAPPLSLAPPRVVAVSLDGSVSGSSSNSWLDSFDPSASANGSVNDLLSGDLYDARTRPRSEPPLGFSGLSPVPALTSSAAPVSPVVPSKVPAPLPSASELLAAPLGIGPSESVLVDVKVTRMPTPRRIVIASNESTRLGGGEDSPAILDDRPGHYPSLVTRKQRTPKPAPRPASTTRQMQTIKVKSTRRWLWPAVAIGALVIAVAAYLIT